MLTHVLFFFNREEIHNVNLIHVSFFYNQFPEETELDLLSVAIDGPSHYSSTSEGSHSVFSSPKTPGVTFQSEDSRRDDSLSSTSEDSEKDEKDEEHERERFYIYRKPSWVAFLC